MFPAQPPLSQFDIPEPSPPAPLFQPQPFQNIPERCILENREDHSAKLLTDFNSTHQNCHNRRPNQCSSAPQSISAQAGPAYTPSTMQNIEAHQYIIDFQHDTAQRRQQEMQLHQQEEHRRQLELQQGLEQRRVLQLQQLQQHQWQIEQKRKLVWAAGGTTSTGGNISVSRKQCTHSSTTIVSSFASRSS